MTTDWQKSLPSLKQWDQLPFSECEEVAHILAKRLPLTFRYVKVEAHTSGSQQRHLLFFEWNAFSTPHTGVYFVFLPGERITLGYDRSKPFAPTFRQHKSWEEETRASGFSSETLEEFLRRVMSPLRQVQIPPFLLQVVATDPAKAPVMVNGKKKRRDCIYHHAIVEELLLEGFHLPSADEWEYACGAGTRTLFRWGNYTPACYPIRPHNGNLDHPMQWSSHLQSNAFGLFIANDPYAWEFCAKPEIMLGGDGGTALHAGVGEFASWLSLATSYQHKLPKEYINKKCVYNAHYRRCFRLE